MSRSSAALFRWIQAAPFYREVHREAVELLPEGVGRRWLDVGCGPGLVARLAQQRGYDVLGVDLDPAMVRSARAQAPSERCRFEIGDLDSVAAGPGADVVSAASLLFVLPDRRLGLLALWRAVRAGGALLIVETTAAMTPANARRAAERAPAGRRLALWLWARVRQGRAIEPSLLDEPVVARRERHALLDGLVEAWVLHKPA